MANVAHNTLTGADLHEPKGISSATANTVYVANGAGSGTWSSGSVLVGITGQIADFATPLPPTGWLECDGSNQSRSSFAALFAAMTIQQTGTRTASSAVITGLSSTTNMRAGYAVGAVVGGQITNGSVILSVDSPTQITMNTNALSSGSATVVVSPYAQGDGTTTFTLPNSVDRYRRSRGSNRAGIFQTDATKILTHTHTQGGTFTSGGVSANHTHGQQGTFTSGGQSVAHTHTSGGFELSGVGTSGFTSGGLAPGNPVSSGESTTHSHDTTISGATGAQSADHSHNTTISGQTGAPSTSGDAETRPVTLVVLTCIKT